MDRRISDSRRLKAVNGRIARLDYPGRLILEPGLIRGHFARLSRSRAIEVLLTLPAFPGEFVVVPHTNERPASAGVLQVRVQEISLVKRPIVVYRSRHVKVTKLFTMRVTDDVTQPPRVHSLRTIFGIPDNFIDEVAEVEHEAESLVIGPPLVFPDHPAVSRRSALLNVLAANEGKAHGSAVLIGRRSDCATNPAAEAMLIRKAVPIDARRLEIGRESAAGPI